MGISTLGLNSGIDTSTPIQFTTLIVNLGLITLFGISHSFLARKSMKQKFKQIIPKELIRSLYVLVASIFILLLVLLWQPIGVVIYDFRSTAIGTGLKIISVVGLLNVFLSTFIINHFRLFGLTQSTKDLRGEDLKPVKFQTPYLYNLVRHPLYAGFLIFFWFAPYMTLSNLVLAIGMTIYIVIVTYFEENDLHQIYGDKYLNYMEDTPYRYIPGLI